ncbi:MAG: M14 family zinc carboxypeptidase [Eubacteriales bacterium]|nr:M14 family zinc carboxypeptidase [Eubacteriales bacterium]
MKEVFEKLLSEIPSYDAFLTLDEMEESSRKLAQEYPDIVSLFEIGRSRSGHPLLCLRIGNGSQNGLMFGCPHPNEPIGTMMLEYFTRKLAENEELRRELDYTWYIVKVWDIDGFKLNEKWLKGPYTLYNYSRNFFRPAGYQQVDWTFPIVHKKLVWDKPLPETKAMMDLIDEIKPSFIYSLHNAGFGGVYWYITHETPEIYEAMKAFPISQGIPINYGEPETPACVAYAPAIYANMGIGADYDYLESYGNENPQEALKVGTCSADYAKSRYDTFTFLTEMPYFYDERIRDLSESDMTRKEAVIQNLDWGDRADCFLYDTLAISREYMSNENPFLLAILAFTEGSSTEAYRKMAETDPSFKRKATVAEKFDNLQVSKFYKMLSYGMLIRANESELVNMQTSGEKNPEKEAVLRKAFDRAVSAHKALADELESSINYKVIPISKLVTIQLGCGLLQAEYVHKKHESI